MTMLAVYKHAFCTSQIWLPDMQAPQCALHGSKSWITPSIQLETDVGIKHCSWADLDKVLQDQKLQWGTLDWVKARSSLYAAVSGAVQAQVTSDTHLRQFRNSFWFAFQENKQSQLKLERFPAVLDLVQDSLLPSIIQQSQDRRMEVLQDMVDALFNCHAGGLFPADAFSTLQRRIEGFTLEQMFAQLSSLGDPETVPADFHLKESDSIAAERAALEDRSSKLKAAGQAINKLAGLPALGSYASVVTHDSKLGANCSDPDAGEDDSYRFVWPSGGLALSVDPDGHSHPGSVDPPGFDPPTPARTNLDEHKMEDKKQQGPERVQTADLKAFQRRAIGTPMQGRGNSKTSARSNFKAHR